ncbi:MAG: ROK family protein [Alphaproteobacteria bacterium]|nr:ROK family protein [Alphaproteobacteria bacterium]MDD9920575.1 ROK family protein [Alphaproteobacteria bacterium]
MTTSILAIDIGASSVKVGLFDDLNLTQKFREELPKKSTEAIKPIVQKYIRKFNAKRVGIATASSVQLDGMVRNATNIQGYKNYHWSEHIDESIELKVLNDGHAAALGVFHCDDTIEPKDSLVHIVIGTGIGGGIIINGKLWRGTGGCAGHFGNLILNNNEDGYYLQDLAAAHIYKNEQGCITDENIEKAARQLGRGIASIVHCFNPAVITLGGGVIDAFTKNNQENSLLNLAIKSTEEVAKPATWQDTTVKITSLKNDAALYGMASLFLDQKNRHY